MQQPVLSLLAALLAALTAAQDGTRCPAGLHQCVSRNQVKCFLPDAVCDGERDCQDGSDERGCTSCRPGSLLCQGRCARRCDAVLECEDGRDELACPHCRGGAVLCQGRCVPLCSADSDINGCVWRCDGIVECSDGGDEAGCYRCAERATDLPCGRPPPQRVLGEPRPYHNVTCGRECDGVPQCSNGWDEWNCDAR